MLVKLADIFDDGLELNCQESAQDLSLVYPDTLFERGIVTRAHCLRVDDTVTTSGKVQTVIGLECGRCAKAFSYPVQLDFDAAFSPKTVAKPSSPKAIDQEISKEELGLYYYSGQSIDLGELVREHVLLAIPMVPLCHSNCRGLCSICGRDLNVEDCGCMEENNGSS